MGFCGTIAESLVGPGSSHGSHHPESAGWHRKKCGGMCSWEVNAKSQSTPRQIAGVTELFSGKNVPPGFRESRVSVSSVQQIMSAAAAMFGDALFVHFLLPPNNPAVTFELFGSVSLQLLGQSSMAYRGYSMSGLVIFS